MHRSPQTPGPLGHTHIWLPANPPDPSPLPPPHLPGLSHSLPPLLVGEHVCRYCVLTKGLLVSYSTKHLALAEDGQYDNAAGAVDMTVSVVCEEMDITTCVPLSLVRECGFQMQQLSKAFMCYAEVGVQRGVWGGGSGWGARFGRWEVGGGGGGHVCVWGGVSTQCGLRSAPVHGAVAVLFACVVVCERDRACVCVFLHAVPSSQGEVDAVPGRGVRPVQPVRGPHALSLMPCP